MADTRMFFQLVSHRFLLSDSSRELIGSTRGIVRCRWISPIGLAYRSQAAMMFNNSCSLFEYEPDISVLAFREPVLELKAIVERELSDSNVILRVVLSPGAAWINQSICASEDLVSFERRFSETEHSALVWLCATESMNDLSDVASVKKSGFLETQFVMNPCSSLYGSIQFLLFNFEIRLLSRASSHFLNLSLALLNIINFLPHKKNAAVAAAAVTKESRWISDVN